MSRELCRCGMPMDVTHAHADGHSGVVAMTREESALEAELREAAGVVATQCYCHVLSATSCRACEFAARLRRRAARVAAGWVDPCPSEAARRRAHEFVLCGHAQSGRHVDECERLAKAFDLHAFEACRRLTGPIDKE